MSARDAILSRIRRATGRGDDAGRQAAVAERLKSHRRNLIPERGNIDAKARIKLFEDMAIAVQASVAHVASSNDVPEAVAAYLRQHNLPQHIRHGAHETAANMPWAEKAPALEVVTGPAEPADEVSLSIAVGGVAETGTLVLTSGPDNPTTLNFLPENHIVAIRASDVAGSYEDIWDRIRKAHGEGTLPRTVNMVTGPSRTGDIEQRIELGAHGPRRLHIVIIDE